MNNIKVKSLINIFDTIKKSKYKIEVVIMNGKYDSFGFYIKHTKRSKFIKNIIDILKREMIEYKNTLFIPVGFDDATDIVSNKELENYYLSFLNEEEKIVYHNYQLY